MDTVFAIFLLLCVYQLKHFLADYLLQGKYMLGKFKPGWDFLGPLTAHVGVHGLMTFGICGVFWLFFAQGMLFDDQALYAAGVALLDVSVHFVMDRIKASPKYMGRWKPLTGPQWLEAKKTVVELTSTLYPNFWQGPHGDNLLDQARAKLRGNRLFWWVLGFDQMVHHLTHYACIYAILKLAGAL